jgi:hypothetical protein
MTTLASAISNGAYALIPSFGMAGRVYFATDTGQIWYDTGSAWLNVTPPLPFTKVALTPSAPGIFTIAHGLSVVPIAVFIQMTSGGQIWFQSPTMYDAANLYLVASDAGVTGKAVIIA